jgi:ubiquinone/menaquinone biosynthesis C-methylase UbiE
MTNPLVELYDEFAPEYERTRVPRFRPFVKRLFQLYDTRPGSYVLDAGCGTGLAAVSVAPRVGHSGKILGVDASTAMLEIARKKAQGFGFDQCEFVQADMANLKLPDESFDLVVCSFALWNEPGQLFGEFHRLLKPHGALLLQNWSADKDAPTKAYDAVANQYLDAEGNEASSRIRAIMSENRVWWDTLAAPEDYANLLLQVGFSAARGEWCALPMHFANAQEFAEFMNLAVWRRRQVALLSPEQHAKFVDEAQGAVRPFETTKGIEVESRAIQVLARK